MVSLVPSDSYAVGIMGIMGIMGTMGIRSCVICVDVIVSVISPYSLMMLALPHNPHSTHTPQHPLLLRNKTSAKRTTLFPFHFNTNGCPTGQPFVLRYALNLALGVVKGDDHLAVGRHIEHHIHHYSLADGA